MKSAIVIDETLPTGLLANTAACIATGLFRQVPQDDAYGQSIQGADHLFEPITQIPILILKQGKRDFNELLRRIQASNVRCILFTKEAQTTPLYDEYVRRTEGKKLEDLTIVGIGVIGDDADVKTVVGDLPLLR